MNASRTLVSLLAAATLSVASVAQAQGAGWTAEFTVRVESAGQRPVTASPYQTAVKGTQEWRTAHELRGKLAYAQRLRGAVATNQPDRNNEQRYESWLARVSSAGLPAHLTLEAVRSEESSGRVVAVDGEGAGAINRQNAGKIGRIEHRRSRSEVKVDAPDGARMGGAYLQIDRVANQVRFEVPSLGINPARATVTEQSVARLDKAPAAGEWDRNETTTPSSIRESLWYPQEFVFDVPAATLATAGEITLTQEFKAGGIDWEREASRGSITIVLRRGDAAAAAAPAAAATATAAAAAAGAGAAAAGAAAPASAQNPCPPPSRTAGAAAGGNDAQRTGREVGAEVGGAVLGGGWGRSIGANVGGVLGALGGGAKKEEPKPANAPADCPR